MPFEEAVGAIHPCLYYYKTAKLPDVKVNFLKSLQSFISPNASSHEIKRFLSKLDDTYKAFVAALESTAISEDGFILALKDYLGVLLALVDTAHKPQQHPNELDQALDAANPPPLPTNTTPLPPSHTIEDTSPLRFSLQFSWNQSLIAETITKPAKSRDAVFEVASSLIAAAVWCIRRANSLCESTPVGIASGPSLQAYKVLRQASGLLQYCNASIVPMIHPDALAASIGVDCSADALQATSLCCLADAQGITVLRAIQKGNEPTLISSLSRDARDQYTEAATALSSISDGANCKLFCYLAYKQASYECYSHIFNGIAQWKRGNAGTGLRSLKEAEICYRKAKKAANVYDKAAPSSLGQLHRRFDDELDRILYDTQRRIEKENSVVYYQTVPSDVPALPEGKRLSAPDGFALPEKSRIAVELDPSTGFSGLPASPNDSKKKKKKKKVDGSDGCHCTGPGCCCWKWLCCCCVVQAATESVVAAAGSAATAAGHGGDETHKPTAAAAAIKK